MNSPPPLIWKIVAQYFHSLTSYDSILGSYSYSITETKKFVIMFLRKKRYLQKTTSTQKENQRKYCLPLGTNFRIFWATLPFSFVRFHSCIRKQNKHFCVYTLNTRQSLKGFPHCSFFFTKHLGQMSEANWTT